jgi:dihydroorotate dehydrogenase electron transfer subunit
MKLTITDNRELANGIWQMDMTGDFPYRKVQAGQFVHIQVGDGLHHVLRRPISIAEVVPEQKRLTIVFRVVGEGTKWLSQQTEGMSIDLLGPLGNGFAVTKSRRSLIVGGGIGIPPLYELAKRLAKHGEMPDIYLGFRTSNEVFWYERFAKLGNTKVYTEDGLLGSKGFVTEGIAFRLTENAHFWENVYACGPRGMLQAVQMLFAKIPIGGGVSLEERMACGVGACYGCTCETSAEVSKRICVDGPVFAWKEVKLS